MTNPPIRTEEFRGKCPICSGFLHHDEADTNFVHCASKPDHYRIEVKKFNTAWETFEKKYIAVPIGSGVEETLANELMSALLTNNVAVNAPPVDPSKFTVSKEE